MKNQRIHFFVRFSLSVARNRPATRTFYRSCEIKRAQTMSFKQQSHTVSLFWSTFSQLFEYTQLTHCSASLTATVHSSPADQQRVCDEDALCCFSIGNASTASTPAKQVRPFCERLNYYTF